MGLSGNWADDEATADLIDGIGRRDFPARLLGFYQRFAGCDFCSAFSLDEESGPRLLFAAGSHDRIPDFARRASTAYAERYWREDQVALAASRHRADTPFEVMATRASDIPDPVYRAECYDRAGVGQRFSLIGAGARPILISGYRRAGREPVGNDLLLRIGALGPVLVAAVRRHGELAGHEVPATAAACREIYRLRALEAQLSNREAKVVASLAVGDRQKDIAEELGLAVASVVTYRRRAYRKLGVHDRRQLRRLLDEGQLPEQLS